jgi:hypothetical protein
MKEKLKASKNAEDIKNREIQGKFAGHVKDLTDHLKPEKKLA